jgi:hypothetical protein
MNHLDILARIAATIYIAIAVSIIIVIIYSACFKRERNVVEPYP